MKKKLEEIVKKNSYFNRLYTFIGNDVKRSKDFDFSNTEQNVESVLACEQQN